MKTKKTVALCDEPLYCFNGHKVLRTPNSMFNLPQDTSLKDQLDISALQIEIAMQREKHLVAKVRVAAQQVRLEAANEELLKATEMRMQLLLRRKMMEMTRGEGGRQMTDISSSRKRGSTK